MSAPVDSERKGHKRKLADTFSYSNAVAAQNGSEKETLTCQVLYSLTLQLLQAPDLCGQYGGMFRSSGCSVSSTAVHRTLLSVLTALPCEELHTVLQSSASQVSGDSTVRLQLRPGIC